MEVSGLLHKRRYFTLTVAILITAATFAICYGVSLPRRYPLKVGERSKWDVSAPFEMEDRALTERYAEEAARAAPKVYVRDGDLSAAIVARTEAFVNVIAREHNSYRDTLVQRGAELSEADIDKLCDDSVTKLCDQAINFKVSISREEAACIITEVARAELDAFFGEFLAKIKELAETSDITAENYNDHIAALWRAIQQTMYANQNLKNVASLFAPSALGVNTVVDEQQTRLAQEQVRERNLERKIIIPKGRRILSVDEIVTSNIYQLLDANGLIEDGEVNIEQLIKVLFVLLGIAVLFFMYLSSVGMELIEDNSQVLQLGCIIVTVLAMCRFLYPLHRLAMPIYIAPILIAYLINTRVALVINIYILSALSLFAGIDVKTMLFFLIGGALSAIMMMNASTRARFTLVAFSLSLTCVFLFIALSSDIMNISNYMVDAAILFVTCAASSFLSMGLVALMEGLFNTATPLRLTELSSGNTPLLRQLSIEAPGTHHHSLMVGMMAEAAAVEIGANPFITKAGAYYHDVGKLAAPGFFAENLTGPNPHDTLPPEESRRIIISHTAAGVELCAKGKLPRQVVSIVREHHGDTAVAYFLKKAERMYGEGNVNKDDYRYPGPRPSSREAALVMMADSCEAAVRSSDKKDELNVSEWVHKIIRSKIDDGQLESCMISMQDVLRIEQSFVRVLNGFYHTRIGYPDDERNARSLFAGAAAQINAGVAVAAGAGTVAGAAASPAAGKQEII